MRILIFTVNPLHNAPRVIREIEALKEDFEIVATGITPPHDDSIKYINAEKFLLTHFEYTLGKIFQVISFGKVFKRRYFTIQRKIDKLLKDVNPDLVIVHPGTFLPYFFSKNKSFKVIFNAHEFHPREFESDLRWRNTWGKIHHHIYQTYLPRLDLMINVCEGIAKECLENYHTHSIVIPNAGTYHDELFPKHKSEGKIRMIHHGVAIKSRQLEMMIDVAAQLEGKFELDMMLVFNDETYHQKLKRLADKYNNVRIIPPVKFDEIVPILHDYDLGIFLLPPDNFNYLHALPNKFFEFIQARLAIAVGPSPEMASLVKKHNFGVVSSDFQVHTMVQNLRHLSHDEVNSFKDSSHLAAELLNSDNYKNILLSTIINLLK
ncbi:glycosyltransferase family protein [Algoriphagus aquimarinus]|uniref:Glycosyltransferase family 4 protein n=1 Tax=Algoriphagus aquimarinus TaxID=237018 RepID=A0A1I1A2H4_9BACT|nr:hypothetical protein [Algoriphagus aquimarinus]SFB30798.1 hypothetical protein SAMN04489723_10747 [Algoriphagus aquimarinus]